MALRYVQTDVFLLNIATNTLVMYGLLLFDFLVIITNVTQTSTGLSHSFNSFLSTYAPSVPLCPFSCEGTETVMNNFLSANSDALKTD